MRYSSLALLAACSLAANAALAANSTITFKGTVTDQTCDVSVNGQQDIELQLPTVHADAFTGKGTVVGNTPFTVTVSGCKDRNIVSELRVVFIGNNVVDDGYLGNLATDKPAGNVALRLNQGADGTNPIKLQNAADSWITLPLPNLATESTSQTLSVQYISLDDNVTPGRVLAKVEYKLEYL